MGWGGGGLDDGGEGVEEVEVGADEDGWGGVSEWVDGGGRGGMVWVGCLAFFFAGGGWSLCGG